MKKKILNFMLGICLLIPCFLILSACTQNSTPPEPDPNIYATKQTIQHAEIKVVEDYYSSTENVTEDGRVFVQKSNHFYIKVVFEEGYQQGTLAIILNGTPLTMTNESSFLISEMMYADQYEQLVITATGNVSLITKTISVNFIEADEGYLDNLQLSTELSREEVRQILYAKYKFKFNTKFRELLALEEDRYYTGNELRTILSTGKNIEVTHGDVLQVMYACNGSSAYEQYIESPLIHNNPKTIEYTQDGVLSTITMDQSNMSSWDSIDLAVFNTNSDLYSNVTPSAYFINEDNEEIVYINQWSTPFMTFKVAEGETLSTPYASANQEDHKAYLVLSNYETFKTYYDDLTLSVNNVTYYNTASYPNETKHYFTISDDGIVEINLLPLWQYGTANESNNYMQCWDIQLNDIASAMVKDGVLVKVNYGEFVIAKTSSPEGDTYVPSDGVLLIESTLAYYCKYQTDSKENPIAWGNNLYSVYFYKNNDHKYKLRLAIREGQEEFQLFKVAEGSTTPQFIANINSTTNTDTIKVTIGKIEISNMDVLDIEIDLSILNDGEYLMFGTGFTTPTEA